MQAQVRLADRVVLQTGTSLGEIRDDKDVLVATDVVELAPAKANELRDALTQRGRGDVHLAVDGTITIDGPKPPPVPTPEQQAELDKVAADTDICRQFYRAANGAPTDAQRDAALKAFMRLVRRELAQ